VSSGVVSKLEKAGFAVTRISGADRYEVAENVARRIERLRGHNKVTAAFVVRGDSHFDAMSVSAVAYARMMPILYTRPTKLNDHTASAIGALDVKEVVIGGGRQAVTPSTERAIHQLRSVDAVTRWGGDDLVATAVAINEGALERGWVTFALVGVTSCQSYSDGLSASSDVGYRAGVLLPVTSTNVPAGTADFVEAHKTQIDAVRLIGGPSTASDAVLERLRLLLR
jgi:hypothetical protein